MTDEVIKGIASDGKEFTAESPEVKEYLEKNPDVNLDAAIGSVINIHNATPTDKVVPVTEDEESDPATEDVATEGSEEPKTPDAVAEGSPSEDK